MKIEYIEYKQKLRRLLIHGNTWFVECYSIVSVRVTSLKKLIYRKISGA